MATDPRSTGPSPRVLVLSDADVPGLVAATAYRESTASVPEAPWPLVMAFPFSDGRLAERERALLRQAELLSMRIVPPPATATPAGALPGLIEAQDLLLAAYTAAGLGCSTLIWPAQAAIGDHLDLDRIAQIHDRALLISRLVSLDSITHGQTDFRVLAPYADLTDRQLVDLAADLAAPVDAAWWAGSPSPDHTALRARWDTAFQSAGWSLAAKAPS